MADLAALFGQAGRTVPDALSDWDDRVAAWLDEYCADTADAEPLEIAIESAVFLFDYLTERVILAYAVSTPQLTVRDASRMRGFPDVNRGVRDALGEGAFLADRGHFLGHTSGGRMDINLFPHRRELNRGWSAEGRLFRKMERHVAEHPGTFFYHRPVYDDDTWIPAILEYGVLVDSVDWWVGPFANKTSAQGSAAPVNVGDVS